jgi:hypothetical protein
MRFEVAFMLEAHNEFNESTFAGFHPFGGIQMNLKSPQIRPTIWSLSVLSLEAPPLGTTLWTCSAGAKTPLNWPANSSHFQGRGPK